MVGFCGGGGTPLFSGTEAEIAAEWCPPQSEYRPTEYLQRWVGFWFDDDKRLRAAQRIRRHESVVSIRNGQVADCVIAGLSLTPYDLTLCCKEERNALNMQLMSMRCSRMKRV